MMRPAEAARSTALYEPRRFGLPGHIHVCVTAAGSVILDVKRDKYLGLGREATELLADVVAGWPEPLWQRSLCTDRGARLETERATCEALVADGVLERIAGALNARIVPPLKDMRAEWIAIGDELEAHGRVTLARMTYFLEAYFWARSSLAWHAFSTVVEDVRARKARGAGGMQGFDIERLAAMVDVFRRLRVFVFAAEGHCLLHALTLVRFLSHYQFYPEWVIGVTTQPWGAHSWVQWDQYLLDTNPEKVCGYTPIMMV
jgi:Transglutaminase-like superfamily